MKQGSIIKCQCHGIPLGAQVLVRVPRSHRKRDRFVSRLQRKPEYLYSFHFDGNFVYVSHAELIALAELATRPRVDTTKLLNCWK